jgi:creatinine amidohydrolase
MGLLKLAEMTWPEVERLDKNKTLVLIPISPIEEHGPHLPLGTDIFGARDIAAMAARLVLEKDQTLKVLLAPEIPLGCASITADFPGTISLRGSTLFQVVSDVCRSLVTHGFRYIVISNHHLDPVHMKAILSAIEEISAKYDVHITETASRSVYAGLETEETRQGQALGADMDRELHADIRETSFIRYCYPSLCKQDPEKLPAVFVDVRQGFRKGYKTFKQMGANAGYIGSPGLATPDYGRLHLEEGARLAAELALKLIRGEELPEINPRIRKFLDLHVKLD